MSQLSQLPIWRDATRLLVMIETAVKGFPRYHKYALGTDLRRQAMGVCRLIQRAVNESEKHRRFSVVKRLQNSVDDLKILIQLGKEIKAFRSFAEFQRVAEVAIQIGKQCGSWQKRLGQKF